MIDNSVMQEVSKIITANVPNRHTFFQLNFFVIGKEPTHQAKLRRCVEELKARKQQIDSIMLEIDELRDKNELLYWEMGNTRFVDGKEREIRCRMADRRIINNNKAIDDLQDRAKSTEEEIVFFVRAFQGLSEIEPMKEWDDLEVQTEYWNAKIAEEVSHRMLMQLPLDIEVVRTALALPGESPIKKHVSVLLQQQAGKMSSLGKDYSIGVVA